MKLILADGRSADHSESFFQLLKKARRDSRRNCCWDCSTKIEKHDQCLDRLREADATLQQAVQRKLEITDLVVQQYDVAFLQGNQAGMERIKAGAQGNPEAED
jgi:hypothetical protein